MSDHATAPPRPTVGLTGSGASAPRDASAEEDRERLQAAVGDTYRVGRRIGQGQCSAVFRAIRSGKHTEVALKLLDIDGLAQPDLVQRLAALTHRVMALIWDTPVVPVTIEQYSSTVLLVMPLVETGSVATVLSVGEPLSIERVLAIVSQVATVLDTLQDRGMSHRGLTPENILLGRADQVCLTDVGVTDLILGESGTHGARLSKARAYAAPEQRRGKHVDGRADQYSLAIIAYELLTGRRRVGYEAVEGIDTLAPIDVHADAPLRKDLPLYANLALRRALSASPANRFPTSTAFADALAGKVSSETTGLPTKRADLRLTRRSRIAVGGVAFVGVLALCTALDPRLHAAARDAWRRAAARFSLASARVDLAVAPTTDPGSSAPAASPPNRAGANQRASGAAAGAAAPPSRAGARQPKSTAVLVASTATSTASNPATVRLGPALPAAGMDSAREARDALAAGKGAVHGVTSWFSRLFSRIFLGSAASAAYVRVSVDKGAAIVAIDGVPRGTAPLLASVAAGHHTVTIVGSGSYDATSLGITATPGDTVAAAFHSTNR